MGRRFLSASLEGREPRALDTLWVIAPMTPKEAQLLRAQRALSPARAPSSLAQRVAHAVVESRGSTDVVSDMRLGSEKTTQHAQSRTPIAALGIFFGLFLLIAWAAPSPRSSLGVASASRAFWGGAYGESSRPYGAAGIGTESRTST